ncbi:MAG: carboxypeptidase regulatory-like domain-containing protein [Vicinamibacteraceae bacterium]
MMRPATALLVTGLVTVSTGLFGLPVRTAEAAVQTPPATPAPAPIETPRPAAPRPATPRPRPSTGTAATLTMTVKVTDSGGSPLVGANVTATGPATRAGVTDATGTVRFLSLRGGTYRLRFESATTITLERDVVLRAGMEPIEATPTPAPPPPPPPPTPEPTRNDIAGRGPLQAPQPRTVSIPEFIERNMLGSREPAKTTQVACGATSVTNVLQIRDPLKDQAHPDADALIYVVGGDGLLVLPIADVPLSAGTFSLVPRGTTYTLQRRGRSGLVLLQTLTDTLCPAK